MAAKLDEIDTVVLADIFSYLKPDQISFSLQNLSHSTNTLLDKISKDNHFWLSLVETLIEKHIPNPRIRDWKVVYYKLIDRDYILNLSLMNDYVEIVEVILKDTRKDIDIYSVFNLAVSSNSLETVKFLLKQYDIDYNESLMTSIYSRVGVEIFELLLSDKRIDPSINDNEAIISLGKSVV